MKLASLALMRACSGYSICTIPFPRGYIMFWRRPQHSLMTPQTMTHTSTYKVCLCKKSARLRARAHRQKHKIQALTMTPTRPTMIRSSFSRPSHDPNPQTNHRTTASTSMATHWRGSARCGARCAANSFVLFKTRKNSFELVRLLRRSIQTGLVSRLFTAYRARPARGRFPAHQWRGDSNVSSN